MALKPKIKPKPKPPSNLVRNAALLGGGAYLLSGGLGGGGGGPGAAAGALTNLAKALAWALAHPAETGIAVLGAALVWHFI